MDGTLSIPHQPAVADADIILAALEAPFAVIDFLPSGEIIRANDNFLAGLEYEEHEVVGKHHSLFVFPDEHNSEEYRKFWDILRKGRFHSGEYCRRRKSGKPIWIAAHYVPICAPDGAVISVRKYATDITERHDAVSGIVNVLSRLASGDITARLNDDVTGAFAHIRVGYNETAEGLERHIRSIMGVTGKLGNSTEAVADTATRLSERADIQASELKITAETMNGIAETVRGNSKAAKQVQELTSNAAEKAEGGRDIASQTVEAMKGIEGIIVEVTKITKVIENFAFQTNLLSINAAVEAARAGDLGRGFAVVASEVRNLAQRSAEASKDIAKLTQESETKVAQGVELASNAGLALKEIASAIADVKRDISDISEASQQQSDAVTDVEGAVRKLETGVGEVAHLATESTSQAKELSVQHAKLEEFVQSFSTRKQDPGFSGYSGPDRRQK